MRKLVCHKCFKPHSLKLKGAVLHRHALWLCYSSERSDTAIVATDKHILGIITPVLRDMQLSKPEPLQHPPVPLDTSVTLEVGGGEVSQLSNPPFGCLSTLQLMRGTATNA